MGGLQLDGSKHTGAYARLEYVNQYLGPLLPAHETCVWCQVLPWHGSSAKLGGASCYLTEPERLVDSYCGCPGTRQRVIYVARAASQTHGLGLPSPRASNIGEGWVCYEFGTSRGQRVAGSGESFG